MASNLILPEAGFASVHLETVMAGAGSVRFSDLFADTVNVHGINFAFDYYIVRHGMAVWEFKFWRLVTCG